MEGSGWSWHRGKSRDTCRPCFRKMCCCSKSWKWGQWSMAHWLCGVGGSLWWLQKEQGPFASALHKALACLLAVQLWFCTAHCAQFCTVTNGHISQGPRVVYRSSLSLRHAEAPARQSCLFSIQLLLQDPQTRELFTQYWLPSRRHGAFQITRHQSLSAGIDPK